MSVDREFKAKIGIFYHCRLSGGDRDIAFGSAAPIMQAQMSALQRSGLLDRCSEFIVGSNGDAASASAAKSMTSGATVIDHGSEARSELPTLKVLRDWLPSHPDWYVFYHHIKGVTHPNSEAWAKWRRCMESHCVWGWRRCVSDLDVGSCSSVGAHWLTPEEFPDLVRTPFWGGNFWWAKASFLLGLPPIPDNAMARSDFYLAESWIGSGELPAVVDYAPHWPTTACEVIK